MTDTMRRVKPSLLEGGLPCPSLSAEAQRDNNARQRPPQNRLHIWWARRPPTVSRAAILGALLPFDLALDAAVLPPAVPEPDDADLEALPRKLEARRAFFERLRREVLPTHLTESHRDFVRAMGITGDVLAAEARITAAQTAADGPITMPAAWGFRHAPAFAVSPSSSLLGAVRDEIAKGLGTER